jgi:serine/threonine-protein kinase
MEFLEGEPLDKRLDQVGRLPARDAARIVMQICRALAKAHAAGIVHRDLKPDNVFLVWDDEDGSDVAKVVDFGIAKFTDSKGPTSATRTGSVLGTPYYMSPEQARGLRTVDYRSDLWSVGVITFRCMTGHLPFEGEAVGDVLVKLCTAPLPVPSQYVSDLPPGFDTWFARALAREPEGRFQSAAELSTTLAAVCGLTVPLLHGDSAGGSSPNIRVRVSSAATPYTPTPMGATTPSPMLGRAPQITGAPITQTPAPRVSKSTRGGLVLGGITLLVLLGIGAGVLAKVLGPADTTTVHDVGSGATKPEVIPLPKPVEPPPEVKTPAIPAPAPPTPSATAEPIETAVASPRKQQKRPAGRPSGKAKPQPSAKTSVKPPEDIGF